MKQTKYDADTTNYSTHLLTVQKNPQEPHKRAYLLGNGELGKKRSEEWAKKQKMIRKRASDRTRQKNKRGDIYRTVGSNWQSWDSRQGGGRHQNFRPPEKGSLPGYFQHCVNPYWYQNVFIYHHLPPADRTHDYIPGSNCLECIALIPPSHFFSVHVQIQS